MCCGHGETCGCAVIFSLLHCLISFLCVDVRARVYFFRFRTLGWAARRGSACGNNEMATAVPVWLVIVVSNFSSPPFPLPFALALPLPVLAVFSAANRGER